MTDTDDTKESALSFYGDIVFKSKWTLLLVQSFNWLKAARLLLRQSGSMTTSSGMGSNLRKFFWQNPINRLPLYSIRIGKPWVRQIMITNPPYTSGRIPKIGPTSRVRLSSKNPGSPAAIEHDLRHTDIRAGFGDSLIHVGLDVFIQRFILSGSRQIGW